MTTMKNLYNLSTTEVKLLQPAFWMSQILFHELKASVAQSYPILCDPMDCSPPVSSVNGIFRQEYWSIPFSKGYSLPRDQTQVSCIAGRFFTIWATGEAPFFPYTYSYCRLQNLYPLVLNCWKPCFHLIWSLDRRENSMKQHLSGSAYLWRQAPVGKIMLERIQKIQLDVKWSSGNTWEYPPFALCRPQDLWAHLSIPASAHSTNWHSLISRLQHTRAS